MRLRAVRAVRAASRKGESKPRPPRVQRGIQRLGWAYFGPHQPFPYINALPLWPMMTHPIPQSLPAIRPFIDMPACGVQRRKQGRSYAPRHPHCAPKRRLAHALRSAARAHRYLQKILENIDLAGGSVTFSIRKWGAAPLKKRLGYREAALMGLS